MTNESLSDKTTWTCPDCCKNPCVCKIMGGVEANQGEPCVSSANGPKGDNLASSTYTLNDCADCDGRGYIAVHDIKNPYVPAQAQCAKCCGSGKVANSPSALIQKLKDEYYIPADIGHKTSPKEN